MPVYPGAGRRSWYPRETEPLGTAVLVHAQPITERSLLNGDLLFDFVTARPDRVAPAASMALRAGGRRRPLKGWPDGDVVHAFVALCGRDGSANAGTRCRQVRHRCASPGLPLRSKTHSSARRMARCAAQPGQAISSTSASPMTSRAPIANCGRPVRRPPVFFDRDGVLNHDSDATFETHKLQWIVAPVGGREAGSQRCQLFRLCHHQPSGVAGAITRSITSSRLHRWMADQMAPIGAAHRRLRILPRPPRRHASARYRRIERPAQARRRV